MSKKPPFFPEYSADREHLESLMERITPEEREALANLFTNGLSKALEQRREQAINASGQSAYRAGIHGAFRDAEDLTEQYSTFLGTLAPETTPVEIK